MPTPSGIGAYAAYLPSYVLDDNQIGAAPPARAGGTGRSVAAFDEDVVTMAVEALRELADPTTTGQLMLATTAAPYEVKTAAGIVHEALGLDPSVPAIDLRGQRCGVSALDLMLRAGGVVAMADLRTTRPGAPDELGQGDAAAGFATGDAAVLLARAGQTVELLERWRLPGEQHDRVWDERFTLEILLAAATTAVTRALAEAGVTQPDHVIVSSSNPRAAAALRRRLGGSGADAALERAIGFTGAAHAGVLLAATLDEAEPGQSVLLVSATEGADAFVFRVGDGIADARRGPAVSDQLAARARLPYGRFLRWRGLLDVQGPARPAAPAPAAPPMYRRSGWKFRLEASQCHGCSAITTPPSRVCAGCGSVGSAEGTTTVSLRDRIASVVSVTEDHLTTMPESSVAIVVADVEGGGRLTGYAADIRPAEVVVGMSVRPTFRRMWTTDGIHNYFWKLRPWEGNR